MLKNSYTNINLFNQALNASWLKNQAIANNIANADTPDYKRETVEFEDLLKSAMGNTAAPIARTHEKHIPVANSIEPRIVKEDGTSFRKDGNNVNIDTEMAELADNQIRYEALTNQLNSQLKRLRMAIQEG